MEYPQHPDVTSDTGKPVLFQDLSYKDKHWHEACFLCNKCRVSLVDKQFGSKADKIYCGNCYDAQFASRCDGCGEIFRAGKCKCPLIAMNASCDGSYLKILFRITKAAQ